MNFYEKKHEGGGDELFSRYVKDKLMQIKHIKDLCLKKKSINFIP